MSAGRVKCAGEIRNFSRVIPPLNVPSEARSLPLSFTRLHERSNYLMIFGEKNICENPTQYYIPEVVYICLLLRGCKLECSCNTKTLTSE
jgi:hypothetical protein